MKAGFQIEQFRVRHNLPIYVMCDILAISSESEYYQIAHCRTTLTLYQKMMFIIFAHQSLD